MTHYLIALLIGGTTSPVVIHVNGVERCERLKADLIRQGAVARNATKPHQHFAWCVTTEKP